MIEDRSGLPMVGLALLRANLPKLTPPRGVELRHRGEKQVLVVQGPEEVYESASFGWGQQDDRSRSLAEALKLLGVTTRVEDLEIAEKDYRLV